MGLYLYILPLLLAGLASFPTAINREENGHLRRFERTHMVQAIGLEIFDQGNIDQDDSNSAVDVVRSGCDESDPDVKESFGDTIVGITIQNRLDRDYIVRKIRFKIPGAGANGRRFRSKRLSPVAGRLIPAGESSVLYFYLADVVGGDAKAWAGTLDPIGTDLGIRNLSVFIRGRADRRRILVRSRTSISIDDFDRCES